MRDVLRKLKKGEHLCADEMSSAMETIVSGQAAEGNIEAFLSGLRDKGETPVELVAGVKVMRAHRTRLSREYPDTLDTCGTGGDGANTLNVSTLAALTASAAGAKVAKHGNRSVSSTCGSADLLEMLGIRIDLEPGELEESLERLGFAFFFAPRFYEATRFAMPARKKLGGKTIFNLLGPLLNPAGAKHQVIGVYGEKWVKPMIEALKSLGCQRALVVHGKDGTDEISLTGETVAAELKEGVVSYSTLSPEQFGLQRTKLKAFQCASKEKALEAAQTVLKGAQGPLHDIVAVNAGAALYVADKAASIKEGLSVAAQALRTGGVLKKVQELKAFHA